MPYPESLLNTRSVISPGKFALIEPGGLVNNVIPGFDQARISIVASPKYGASFVEYLVELEPGGGNQQGFAGEGIESFIFVIEGSLTVKIGREQYELAAGGYAYAPPSQKLYLTNEGQTTSRLVLYKQRYQHLEDKQPWSVTGNIYERPHSVYDGMENVTICDLLPSDLAFDLNFHVLTFQPGGSHPFVETHVQEHGAYLLSGEGLYFLDNQWIPVKQGDFIWFGPYVPQACYATGRRPLSYIYSKDCNRDVEI